MHDVSHKQRIFGSHRARRPAGLPSKNTFKDFTCPKRCSVNSHNDWYTISWKTFNLLFHHRRTFVKPHHTIILFPRFCHVTSRLAFLSFARRNCVFCDAPHATTNTPPRSRQRNRVRGAEVQPSSLRNFFFFASFHFFWAFFSSFISASLQRNFPSRFSSF